MKIIQCGVTMAVPVAELPTSPADAKTMAAMAAEYLADRLKEHTGGVTPRSDFRFQVQDSVMDPLQGAIVPMTLQADYAVEDLPTHCSAYQAHLKESRP